MRSRSGDSTGDTDLSGTVVGAIGLALILVDALLLLWQRIAPPPAVRER